MTVTALDRALVAGDAGQVTGERQERPDPEVPERARRRTFTAQYKQQVLAAYEAAPDGEKGAVLRREGSYSSLISEWRRARDAGALAGLKQPPGVRRLTRGTRRSPGCRKGKPSWRRSWPRPASWSTCSQNFMRSWRRSPRARTPSPGRSPDRRGD
jgi:transposase-like protein